MSIVNLPAVTDIESRDSTLDKDTKILNGYVEVVNKEKTLLLKRPGIDEVLTMASPAAPQLMVKYLNMLFFVMDSTLYYNNQTYALGDSAVCDSVSSYAGSNGGIIDTNTYAVATYAPWSPTTTYTAGQFIVYGLYVYWSLVDDNTGNDPSDATKWHQVAPDEMVGTTWNPATVYDTGDSAIINNVTVWSTVDSNQANIPDATQDTDVWTLLAPLTVTANDLSFTYTGVPYSGGNGVTYAGFIDGDDSGDLGGALAYGGTSQGATAVGTYSIIPSGYTSAKYGINYVAGTLSITAARTYAVWLQYGTGISLSNNNLTITATLNGVTGALARSSIGVRTGKWYWEYTLEEVGRSMSGVDDYSPPLSDTFIGIYAESWGMDHTELRVVPIGIAEKVNNNNRLPYGTPAETGDIISVLLDMDSKTLTYYKQGASMGVMYSGLPDTDLYAVAGDASYAEDPPPPSAVITANFGATAFTYPVPEGYNAGLYTD